MKTKVKKSKKSIKRLISPYVDSIFIDLYDYSVSNGSIINSTMSPTHVNY